MIENGSLLFGMALGSISTFFMELREVEGFGGLHVKMLIVLSMVLLLDYILGVKIARKNGTYQTDILIDACVRDMIMIAIVATFFIVDDILGTGAILYTTIVFALIWNNLQSFVANIYILGWQRYYPTWLFHLMNSIILKKIEKFSGNQNQENQE